MRRGDSDGVRTNSVAKWPKPGNARFGNVTSTLERFGPVRRVEPTLVFEIAFEGIQRSTRHKSGVAVRFPRMARWRKDKTAAQADTLESLNRLLGPAVAPHE